MESYIHPIPMTFMQGFDPSKLVVWNCSKCSKQNNVYPTDNSNFSFQCYNCQSICSHKSLPEKPETIDYYKLLGVSRDASDEEIRKKYRQLALLHHPDRNGGDLESEIRFKEIQEAFSVLSRRKRYDGEIIGESKEHGPNVSFEDLMSSMFGGDSFEPLVGKLSIGKLMDELQQTGQLNTNDNEEDDKKKTIENLAETLKRKFDDYSLPSFDEKIRKEKKLLSEESFGPELLKVIGYVYSLKAQYIINKHKKITGSFSSFLSSCSDNIKGGRNTFTFIKSLYNAHQASKKIEKADESKRAELEQQGVDNMIQFMWLCAKMEIDAVLRKVCDLVLEESGLDEATALKRIGDIYQE